jgi:hypothetical protein
VATSECIQPARLLLPADYTNMTNNQDNHVYLCKQTEVSQSVTEHHIDANADTNMQSDNNMGSQMSTNDTIPWTEVTRKRRSDDITQGVAKRSPNDPRLRNGRTATSNRFSALPVDVPGTGDENAPTNATATKQARPPPIHLRSTDINFLPLRQFLTGLVGVENFKCTATREGVTIHTDEPAHYRQIVQSLRQNNAEFYTYQLKQDKPFRVVVRGLHHTLEPALIGNELTAKGYRVRAITNIISREKVKLPLFYIDLEPDRINMSIFDLDSLCHCKVKVEEPRKRHLLTQCTRCQRYGHSKSYCNLQPRCVRCAEQHESNTCTKTRDTPPKCVLCGGSHPSNYRGCTIHREIQNRRPPQRPPISTPTPIAPALSTYPPLPPSADVHIRRTSSYPTQPSRITYGDILKSNLETQSQLPPAHGDLSSQFATFLTDMRSIMTPMMTLLTQLMQMLLQNHGK